MISTIDKLRCVLREIGYRKHVYRRRVADGLMTEAQAKKELAAVGLEHVKTHEDLPRQHVMIFRKPAKPAK